MINTPGLSVWIILFVIVGTYFLNYKKKRSLTRENISILKYLDLQIPNKTKTSEFLNSFKIKIIFKNSFKFLKILLKKL